MPGIGVRILLFFFCFFFLCFFFFFKQKTAYEIVDCDWSSDVCSSDLREIVEAGGDSGMGIAQQRFHHCQCLLIEWFGLAVAT